MWHQARALQLEVAPERVILAVSAMSACREESGKTSRGAYVAWRAASARPDEWPTAHEVQQSLGDSWRMATSAIGASPFAAPTVGTGRVTGGRAFTADELVRCVQEFAAATEDGPLLFKEYREWARERMLDPDRVLPRYVRAMKCFTDVFGTWRQALDAAGLGDRAVGGHGSPPARDGAERALAQEQAIVWLRRAWATHSADGWMRQDDLTAFRRARRDAAGSPLVENAPDWSRMRTLFGSWPRALHAAGLIDDATLERRDGHPAALIAREEAVASVLRAIDVRGRDLTKGEYDRWTRTERDAGRDAVSSMTIKRRWTWAEIRREARSGLAARARGRTPLDRRRLGADRDAA